MARRGDIKVENNFVRGLITEATDLNFPENAASATDNCRFDRTGVVKRRLGIDAEQPLVVTAAPGDLGVVNEFLWEGAGEEGDFNLLVVQFGSVINFYEADANGNYSGGVKPFSISLITYKTPEASAITLRDKPCSFTSGNGDLFIAHSSIDSLHISYDTASDTITVNTITLQIRDMDGLQDNLPIMNRPLTLSDNHEYNILNQSFAHVIRDDHTEIDDLAIRVWSWHRPDWPSNADISWYYKNAESKWTADTPDNWQLGNSEAPKGHFILEAFRKDRTEAMANIEVPHDRPAYDPPTIPVQTTEGKRPSVIGFFAGRVWYAGVDYDGYRQNIYFSKIIERDEDYGKCYQVNDPTSEELSDLLESDGGLIKILDLGQVYHMIPIGVFLFIFSSQGVWSISGSEGTGFVASDFSVSKVSDVPAYSSLPFVSIEGTPYWWNLDGIYRLAAQQGGDLNVESITSDTIDTFFLEIPADNRPFAKGAYNRTEKEAQWLFRSDAASTVSAHYDYDRILVLDTISGALYPWSVDDTTATIVGIFASENRGLGTSTEAVVSSNDITITNSAFADVTVPTTTVENSDQIFKYITRALQVSIDYAPNETESNYTPGGNYFYDGTTEDNFGGRSPGYDWFNRKMYWFYNVSGSTFKAVVGNMETMTIDSTATLPANWGAPSVGYFEPECYYDPNTELVFISAEWDGGSGINAWDPATNTFPGVSSIVGAGSYSNQNTAPWLMHWDGVNTWLFRKSGVSYAWGAWRWNGTNFTTISNFADTVTGMDEMTQGATGELWGLKNTAGNRKVVKITFGLGAVGYTDAFDYQAVYGDNNLDGPVYDPLTGDIIVLDTTDNVFRKLKASDDSFDLIWETDASGVAYTGILSSVYRGAGNEVTRFGTIESTAGTVGIYSIRTGELLCDYATHSYSGADTAARFHYDDFGNSYWRSSSVNTPRYGRHTFCSSDGLPDEPLVIAAGEGHFFAEEFDTDYRDWDTVANYYTEGNTGVNYESYFTTGAKITGVLLSNGSANYVTVFSNVETNSSCYMNGRYDFSNHVDSGEYSTPQEVYSTVRPNRSVQRKRLKVRGAGPVLKLHFKSSAGKPFNIIGWGMGISANDRP